MKAARTAAFIAAPASAGMDCPRAAGDTLYLSVLTWAFTFFSSMRVVSYLPTLWAIHASGQSSQHSLWTWLTWFGANLTMAAWLYGNEGRRCNATIAVNLGNAAMCFATAALIVFYRLSVAAVPAAGSSGLPPSATTASSPRASPSPRQHTRSTGSTGLPARVSARVLL